MIQKTLDLIIKQLGYYMAWYAELIEEERVIDTLKQKGLEQKKARYFARLAQGSLGRACQWCQLELAEAGLYQTKKKLITTFAGYEYAEALDLAQWFLEETKKIATVWSGLADKISKTDINRRASKTILQIIMSALYDAMKLNTIPQNPLINFDQEPQIRKLSERFDPEQAAEKIGHCFQTLRWIDSSVNEKLIFEQLLLNLAISDKIKV